MDDEAIDTNLPFSVDVFFGFAKEKPERVWALPILTVLAPSKRYYEALGKPQKKLTDWARQMIGERQLSLEQRLTHPQTQWQEIVIPNWYGQTPKTMLVTNGVAVWYKSSFPPITIQWVLIKDPQDILQPKALQCTDLGLQPMQAINYFIRRWAVEVTFEEVRAHLGVESQRQWSDQAIARTTPVLMACFSIVTLWADKLHQSQKIQIQTSAWYQKSHPTFSDAIASVRRQVWRNQKFSTSPLEDDVYNSKAAFWEHLINIATRTA